MKNEATEEMLAFTTEVCRKYEQVKAIAEGAEASWKQNLEMAATSKYPGEKEMYSLCRLCHVPADLYMTNFGVKLDSTGNSRTLMAFIGFRKCNPNKTVEILMDGWQVNGLCIRYHRENKKEKTANTLAIRKKKALEREEQKKNAYSKKANSDTCISSIPNECQTLE